MHALSLKTKPKPVRSRKLSPTKTRTLLIEIKNQEVIFITLLKIRNVK